MNEQLQEEVARLKQERYRLRSALGYIVGLFHNSEHEAKAVAQRVLASAAEPTCDYDYARHQGVQECARRAAR